MITDKILSDIPQTITIIGLGYVGLSLAVLLSQKHRVQACDLLEEKVQSVNARKSPIQDAEIERFFLEKQLNLVATTNLSEALLGADWVIIAVPTDYDDTTHQFDLSTVEKVIEQVHKYAPGIPIVIKSTVSVGFTASIQQRLGIPLLFFSPEFLRETRALYDNLHPSRIVVGCNLSHPTSRHFAQAFATILMQVSLKPETPLLVVGSTEAEAIKLFSNTYLALRVAFFNELDTFTQAKDLSTLQIIKGVCLDPRIGDFYNNPSFGYGRYCLPKDTKALQWNYRDIPENLITAIINSNEVRKDVIAEHISIRYKALTNQHKSACVGIYRLTMKSHSDNFRSSSIQGIIERLNKQNVPMLIYEPTLKTVNQKFMDVPVTHDLQEFKAQVNLIVANRYCDELADVRSKVYTRDLFERD